MDCPLKVMTVLPLRDVVSVLVRGRGSLLGAFDFYCIWGDTK
jgi:hypothetical protein